VNAQRATELVPLLLELTEEFCRELRAYILEVASERGGRAILGTVQDRPETEDVHAEIDRVCEERFWSKCQELETRGLRVWIISEHHPEGYGHDKPNVICQIDPFDGTDQFLRGIWEAWYSVFTFTTPRGQALAGGCVDFISGLLYLADAVNKGVWQVYLPSGKRTEVFPSQETKLSGKSVVASYKGKWRYLAPWFIMVQDYLGRERFAGITHYSWGGSFIYALLAAGVFSVYIMTREPTDEIRPGRAFVVAAGLRLYSVSEEGALRLFRWTQKSRVTFFIAAPNRELAQSIVDGIWGRDEEAVREQRGWLARSLRFLSRPRMRQVNPS